MRIVLPDGLELFAREFSTYKTPAKRTQGWMEQQHETRGAGDLSDTVGTLMLWRYLVSEGIPTTYFLTAGEGDETDLRVSTQKGRLNINVKTSFWQPSGNDEPCLRSHIAIKEIEMKKPLADLFVQVIVHLQSPDNDVSHVHLCNWIAKDSPEFQRQKIQTIPNSGGTRGFWIGTEDNHPVRELLPFLKSIN